MCVVFSLLLLNFSRRKSPLLARYFRARAIPDGALSRFALFGFAPGMEPVIEPFGIGQHRHGKIVYFK
jgi:hypothetical protein